ncbi:MAG: polyprenyl synthetase family protein, partial [Candidatus Omnitrophica bacterium]|nr:polyprenyl synthetase family protein [Candidatus Omnitrophota bacterium]
AGAKAKELNRISHYGIYLGRAFQIKDDILGLFSTEKETGKSNLADIHESKKTILIWHAAHHSSPRDKLTIKQIFKKKSADKNDLLKIRRIVSNSGALNYAKNQVNSLIKKAESINKTLRMRPQYKNSLNTYSKYLLGL